MADFNKFAFRQTLRAYMAEQRGLAKQAAPMPMMPPMGPAGAPPAPPAEASAEPPAEQAAPAETLNIQAKGPEAISAIKNMMGNANMAPTPEELAAQLPPEALAQMAPKMASFRQGLAGFMKADREEYQQKQAALARTEQAKDNVRAMLKRAGSLPPAVSGLATGLASGATPNRALSLIRNAVGRGGGAAQAVPKATAQAPKPAPAPQPATNPAPKPANALSISDIARMGSYWKQLQSPAR